MRYIDKYSAALKLKASIPAIGDFTNKGIIMDFEIAKGVEEPEINRWRIGDKSLRRNEFKCYSLFLTEVNPYGFFSSLVPDYNRTSAFGITREELKNAFYSYKNFTPRSFRVLKTDHLRYKKLCEELHKGRDHELRLGVEFVIVSVSGESEYVQGEAYAQLIKLPESLK